jgi:hypothetical protein
VKIIADPFALKRTKQAMARVKEGVRSKDDNLFLLTGTVSPVIVTSRAVIHHIQT